MTEPCPLIDSRCTDIMRPVPTAPSRMTDLPAIRAISNQKRLAILQWLKEPKRHFRPQVCGDLLKDGVCGLFIAEKLGVSPPTASQHLALLTQAGLIVPKKIKQWTFYKRNEPRIRELKRELRDV